MSLSMPVSRRKLSSASTAAISVSSPRGAWRSNQARKRVTAAPSRSCAARAPSISMRFFTAFIGAIGSEPRTTAPPFSTMSRAIASGQMAGSSQTARCSRPSAARSRSNAALGRTSAISSRLRSDFIADLAQVDKHRRPAFFRHSRESEHHRRMRHIAAADVEQPRHRVRIGDHQRIGGVFPASARGCARACSTLLRRHSAARARPRRRAAAPAGRSRWRRWDCPRRQ